MSWLDRLSTGLERTRQRFGEQINVLFERGPKVDDDFWDHLEESLIAADFGVMSATHIVLQLREKAIRLALPDAPAVLDQLAHTIAEMFATSPDDLFELDPVCVLFVGINGSGKTTTVGKIAKAGVAAGRRVLLGSGDTYRAAAIEQLDIWAERAGVPVIKRTRGSDPGSVAFEVIDEAEHRSADLVLIDTAGRLHTSDDLMRELAKVRTVACKRAATFKLRDGASIIHNADAALIGAEEPKRTEGAVGAEEIGGPEGSTLTTPVSLRTKNVFESASGLPVKTVLVIDANTGQNGLAQAKVFNSQLDLDGVIITKLDGTAKGGIAVAISHELDVPILRVGVGEGIEDISAFDPLDFARALLAPASLHAGGHFMQSQGGKDV
ncbi:MAG: signal recognition particle-docking protein FtsY [Coriobacteriales bacterium]|jgi:fused signal recognition particle receptor|nr:signal recognition particle-docking protein FtsY [Coriobacteriales bacterium]